LDPATGQTLWSNPLKGLGVGTTCLASVRGRTTNLDYALSAEQEAQQQQAAAASAGT
jgi:cytochrome c-type biogenesis protein CcmH/NrfF